MSDKTAVQPTPEPDAEQDYIDITPLTVLMENYANALVEVDRVESEMSDLQVRINNHIAEHFPELANLVKRQAEAKVNATEAKAMVKDKALRVDPKALAMHGKAVYASESERVTQFDEESAIKWIRRNMDKAQEYGVVQFKTNKQSWLNAKRQGLRVHWRIARVETVREARITNKDIKKHATITL